MSQIAKLTALVVEHSEARLDIFVSELERAFGSNAKPTCTLIPVPRLAIDGALFEVDAIAVLGVSNPIKLFTSNEHRAAPAWFRRTGSGHRRGGLVTDPPTSIAIHAVVALDLYGGEALTLH